MIFLPLAWKILLKIEKIWNCPFNGSPVPLRASGFILSQTLISFMMIWEFFRVINEDAPRGLEALGGFLINFIALLKLFMSGILYTQRRKALHAIVGHWESITDADEIDAMHKNLGDAVKIVIVYVGIVTSFGLSFALMIVAKNHIVYLFDPNVTHLEKELPFVMHAPCDQDRYYYQLFIYQMCAALMMLFVHLPHDASYILQTYHACGLLSVIRIRIHRAIDATIDKGEAEQEVVAKLQIPRKYLISAVELHDSALELLSIIERVHNVTWFISLGLNVVGVGFSIIIVLEKKDEILVFFRYIIAFIAALTHFYVVFLPGQKVLGCSEEMCYNCYDSRWFYAEPGIKKLLLIMMIRCQKTNQLTGGNLFVLSMETYCEMMKTGFSFFTIISASL